MTDQSELLLCPFCRGSVKILVTDDEGNPHDEDYENDPYSGLGYYLSHDSECADPQCPILTHPMEFTGIHIYDTREEAIQAWNTRVK